MVAAEGTAAGMLGPASCREEMRYRGEGLRRRAGRVGLHRAYGPLAHAPQCMLWLARAPHICGPPTESAMQFPGRL